VQTSHPVKDGEGSMRMACLAISLLSLVSGAHGLSAQNESSKAFRELYDEYYTTCVADWDAATHMTKEDWNETCRRLAEERVKFRLEQADEFKPLNRHREPPSFRQ
jgi:hypothetical protein